MFQIHRGFQSPFLEFLAIACCPNDLHGVMLSVGMVCTNYERPKQPEMTKSANEKCVSKPNENPNARPSTQPQNPESSKPCEILYTGHWLQSLRHPHAAYYVRRQVSMSTLCCDPSLWQLFVDEYHTYWRCRWQNSAWSSTDELVLATCQASASQQKKVRNGHLQLNSTFLHMLYRRFMTASDDKLDDINSNITNLCTKWRPVLRPCAYQNILTRK